MNGKKARALRKIFRAQGAYSEEPQYKVQKVKKIAYLPNPMTGVPIAMPVEREIIYNMSKYGYRRAKKDYAKGLIRF